LVHITGGSLCLTSQPGKASVTGLFTAPGVLGLGIGGFLAFTGYNAAMPLLMVTIVLAVIALLLPMPIAKKELINNAQGTLLDQHDWIMMLLLLIIAMRSAIWNTFQHIHHGDYSLLLLLAAAAMGGKIAGGYLADRVGWRNYALGALLLAAPLLGLGGRKPLLLAIGIGLLQSVTPLALAAMHKATPHRPALAVGLTLGLAIALGGVPLLLNWQWLNEPIALLLCVLFLAAAYFGTLRLQSSNSVRETDAEQIQKWN
jgi:FSR family fosmidomycin resistance protein-like MFS transporter